MYRSTPIKALQWIPFLILSMFSSHAISAPNSPVVGEPAPQFDLKDQNGNNHTLSQYKGKIVVLEWTNPTCPFVVRHYEKKTMTQLAKSNSDIVWLTINSSHFTTHESNAKWAKAEGVKYVLKDSTGTVGRSYGSKTTPHMYVVDTQGKLAYKGAIDNDPYGDKKSPLNYIAEALKSLKANQPVKTPETKPYGCSVKYKR